MGTSLILWLQSFSTPGLDAFWSLITMLGDETAYMIVLPIVYLAVDRSAGLRLGIAVIFSLLLGFYIKDSLAWLRPWQEHPNIRVIRPEPGYTFPSGHALGTTSLWLGLFLLFRQRWIAIMGVITVITVSTSRLYLGVHYLRDVGAGIAMGAVVVGCVLGLSHRIGRRIRKWKVASQLALGGLIAFGPLLLHATPDTYKLCGYLFGLLGGAALERDRIGFFTAGPTGQRVVRAAVGVVGLFALWALSRPLFPPAAVPQIARYTLLGLWVSFIAPWLAVAAKMANAAR